MKSKLTHNRHVILLIILLCILAVSVGAQTEKNTIENITQNNQIQKNNSVEIVVIHGNGCPHCASLFKFLEGTIKPAYPNLNIVEYEIYSDKENRKTAQKLAKAYGKELSGVPIVFIDGKMIVGFNNMIGETLINEIQRCTQSQCESPLTKLNITQQENIEVIHIEGESSPEQDPKKTDLWDKVTIPAIISAALVDAINPCAFAVLIILLTTILATKSRKRALLSGLAFTTSIFIAYFLMGLGLFTAIRSAGLTSLFYTIVACLAIIVGIFNLKDYLWYGKWFKMEVPNSWRPKMKTIIKGVTSIPGAFLIGFVISLFLLPCTSGPYIVILGLLAESSTRTGAIPLLILYNIIFVLPMLIITFAIFLGITTTEQAEQWRTRKLRILHLIAGVIILLIGIGMFIAMGLGYV